MNKERNWGRSNSDSSAERVLCGKNYGQRSVASKPEWNDNLSDLASMKLSHGELAKKLASRQSKNLILAKAELLERSRHPGVRKPLPPHLAARLRAATSQSLESVLQQCTSAISESQKLRSTELASDGGQVKDIEAKDCDDEHSEPESDWQLNTGDFQIGSGSMASASGIPEHISKVCLVNTEVQDRIQPVASKEDGRIETGINKSDILTLPGFAALDSTVQLIVRTCQSLWLQLEEERRTREYLQQQLHHQGNVITTLTTELLQIQEQQEEILKEIMDARNAGLWSSSSFPRDHSPPIVERTRHASAESLPNQKRSVSRQIRAALASTSNSMPGYREFVMNESLSHFDRSPGLPFSAKVGQHCSGEIDLPQDRLKSYDTASGWQTL